MHVVVNSEKHAKNLKRSREGYLGVCSGKRKMRMLSVYYNPQTVLKKYQI